MPLPRPGAAHADHGSVTPESAFVDWFLDSLPAYAAVLGSMAPEHTGTLGDHSAAAREAHARGCAAWLARLDAAADAGTPAADPVERDLIRCVLRGQRLFDEMPTWRRDPSEYLDVCYYGVYVPFERGLTPERELVDQTVAKLAEIPRVLAACRANLDPQLAPRLLVERGLGQARTGRPFFTRVLPALVEDRALRARVAEAAEPAAAAFDELSAFLSELAQAARGDWRLGEAAYSTVLRERELLDFGAAELHSRGESAFAALDAQLGELARRFPGGAADWRATMAGLRQDAPRSEDAMLAEYAEHVRRARRFCLERDLVTLPEGEECRVVAAPEFDRPVISAASYAPPPALAPSLIGHFHVPFTPAGADEEQIRQRLRANARVLMPTIAVHETYPGHHWHACATSSTRSRSARQIFSTPYFTEGWALYAEGMMREQGYFTDPAHELGQLEARIFRAARVVVDTALHAGDMTIGQAEHFLVRNASLPPDAAREEVERYCADPAQAPAYLTGCLEIEAIRADYLAGGRGSLKQFHDTVAGAGGLPLGLARRVALS